MVAQTGPKIRTGPDKSVGPDFFGPDLSGPDLSGPVRGPDILMRFVVRIFWSGFSRSGPWSGFFGPVRGPDRIFENGFF